MLGGRREGGEGGRGDLGASGRGERRVRCLGMFSVREE